MTVTVNWNKKGGRARDYIEKCKLVVNNEETCIPFCAMPFPTFLYISYPQPRKKASRWLLFAALTALKKHSPNWLGVPSPNRPKISIRQIDIRPFKHVRTHYTVLSLPDYYGSTTNPKNLKFLIFKMECVNLIVIRRWLRAPPFARAPFGIPGGLRLEAIRVQQAIVRAARVRGEGSWKCSCC